MELTNTNRSRAYPDRLGMDVEDTKENFSVQFWRYEPIMTRTSVENSTDVFCYPSSPVGPNMQIRACTKIWLLDSMKGAPLYEQKELRSSGKHRRCEFANGACERTVNAKTLRKDRTVSERKNVAFATRRCVLFSAQGSTFFFTVCAQNDKM